MNGKELLLQFYWLGIYALSPWAFDNTNYILNMH